MANVAFACLAIPSYSLSGVDAADEGGGGREEDAGKPDVLVPNPHYVFVTSEDFAANFAVGQSTASAIAAKASSECGRVWRLAHKDDERTWVALFYATPNEAPFAEGTNLKQVVGGWYRPLPLGQQNPSLRVFATLADITGGQPAMELFTEHGEPLPPTELAWTGGDRTGIGPTSTLCDHWSKSDAGEVRVGNPLSPGVWLYNGNLGCDRRAHLYCLEQDP